MPAMTKRTIWRDGEFVAWRDATVHVLSQSLQRGSLAFDYLSVHRTARGIAVFRLRDHVERLLRTCRIVGLPLGYGAQELVDACAATVRRNPGATSVKISALIPSIEVELVPQDARVAVYIAAYDSDADIIANNRGEFRRRPQVSLRIERDRGGRREDLIPPHAKVAANYTAAMMAKWKARRTGFDDVVLLDERGLVTEAPTTNIFLVDGNGALATPPASKVLLGITRDSVLTLARRAGLACAFGSSVAATSRSAPGLHARSGTLRQRNCQTPASCSSPAHRWAFGRCARSTASGLARAAWGRSPRGSATSTTPWCAVRIRTSNIGSITSDARRRARRAR